MRGGGDTQTLLKNFLEHYVLAGGGDTKTFRFSQLPSASALPNTAADLGFSRWGCANSQIGIILQIFGRKLHENERIWTPGGAHPWRPLKTANTIFYGR